MTGRFASLAAVLTTLIALPSVAQDWRMPPANRPPYAVPSSPETDNQGGEQGLEGIMNQMFERMLPHLEGLGNELQATVNDFSPAFNELSGLVDDIANYHGPERLPNGDIILRRRADAPPPPSTEELRNLLRDPNNPSQNSDTAPGLRTFPENHSAREPETEL
ncbi:MAG: hypothetical protein ACK5II_04415 [Paracoccus sp. (in: a-proteobacteria)]